VARQQLLGAVNGFGAGLTNPGAGDCSITESNSMSMNGCQGAGSRVNQMFIGGEGQGCFNECRFGPSSECQECKDEYASRYTKEAIGTPFPHLGVCGDLVNRNAFSTNFSSATCQSLGDGSCIEQALMADFSKITLDEDNAFTVQLQITAHHWGWSEFRLCREGAAPGGVTQECFNRDVLSFDVEDARQRYSDNMSADERDLQEGRYVPKDPSDYIHIHPERRCNGPDHEPLRAEMKEEYPELWSPGGSC